MKNLAHAMACRGRRGPGLGLCYLVMTGVMAFGSTMMVRGLNEQQIGLRSVRLNAAFHMAEAALDGAIFWIRSQPSPPAGTACFDPFSSQGCVDPQVQALLGGTYTVTIDPHDDNPTSYVDLY